MQQWLHKHRLAKRYFNFLPVLIHATSLLQKTKIACDIAEQGNLNGPYLPYLRAADCLCFLCRPKRQWTLAR